MNKVDRAVFYQRSLLKFHPTHLAARGLKSQVRRPKLIKIASNNSTPLALCKPKHPWRFNIIRVSAIYSRDDV
jgi:hypothetical protein